MNFEGEQSEPFNREKAVALIIDGLGNMTDVQLQGILHQIESRRGRAEDNE